MVTSRRKKSLPTMKQPGSEIGAVLLFCAEVRYAQRIRTVLGEAGRIVVAAEDSLGSDVPAERPTLIVAGHEPGHQVVALATEARRRFPQGRMTVIVSRDAESVRALLPLNPERILWCGAEDQLCCGLESESIRKRLAREFGDPGDDVNWVRVMRLLNLIFQMDPPLRTVNALAQVLRCHRTSLSRMWRREVGPGRSIRLEDVLLLNVLLAALETRHRVGSWSEGGALTGASERTMRTGAHRFFKRNLTQLARMSDHEVFEYSRDAIRSLLAVTPVVVHERRMQ